MLQVVLLLLLATARAEPSAEDESIEEAPAAPAASATFAEMLDQAKSVYFDGRDDDALKLFLGLQVRLLLGEEPPWDLAAMAMVYVGEIEYRRGNHDEARDAFRWLLKKDPDYQISPYSHPIEVVAVFSTVRDQVSRGRGDSAVEPISIEPMPGWGYLPLGLPQFRQKRPALGAVFAGLQAGLGGASVGVYVNLRYLTFTFPEENNQAWVPSEHPRGWATKENKGNTNRMRYQLQWPLFVATYATYATSVVEARGHWRRSFVTKPAVSVLPMPEGGSQVVFSGRF